MPEQALPRMLQFVAQVACLVLLPLLSFDCSGHVGITLACSFVSIICSCTSLGLAHWTFLPAVSLVSRPSGMRTRRLRRSQHPVALALGNRSASRLLPPWVHPSLLG